MEWEWLAGSYGMAEADTILEPRHLSNAPPLANLTLPKSLAIPAPIPTFKIQHHNREEHPPMQVQFNSDSSVMGTENVAARIESKVREKLARFEERLTRLEIHVHDENGRKGGGEDKACTIEARPRGGRPIGVTEHAAKVDDAARKAATTLAQRLERFFGRNSRHGHDPRPDKAM